MKCVLVKFLTFNTKLQKQRITKLTFQYVTPCITNSTKFRYSHLLESVIHGLLLHFRVHTLYWSCETGVCLHTTNSGLLEFVINLQFDRTFLIVVFHSRTSMKRNSTIHIKLATQGRAMQNTGLQL